MKKIFSILSLLITVTIAAQTGPSTTFNGKVFYGYRPVGTGNTTLLTLNTLTNQLEFQEAIAGISLGETSTTAYRGDRGKIAYDHSQTTGNPHNTQISQISGLQGAIDLKAPLASPALTGVPTAPTAAPGTNTTQLANTDFVVNALSNYLKLTGGINQVVTGAVKFGGSNPNVYSYAGETALEVRNSTKAVDITPSTVEYSDTSTNNKIIVTTPASITGGNKTVTLQNVTGTIALLSDVTTATSGVIAQTIANGVTTSAPSQDAIFDALQTKNDNITYSENYPINTIVADGQHNAFPGLTELSDGSLLMIYRKATTHDVVGLGKLVTRLSTDKGITWGAEIIKFNTASTDYRDPSLFTLSNGNVLLSYFKYASSVFTPYTSVSTDGGVTFGTPVALMPSASSGGVSSPAIQLTNGDLLIATYNTVGSNYRIVINKSTNGGASWSNISFLGSEPTSGGPQKYTEPNLLLMPNGQILLSARNEVSLKVEFSKSSDSGVTWSALTPKFDGLSRASMLMDGNRVIVSYRGSGPQGSRTAISYSNDFGETFGDFPNLIKTVGTRNDVYSAMAKLGNDKIGFAYAYENTIDIANVYFKYISSNSSIYPSESNNFKNLNIVPNGTIEFLQGLYTYMPDTTKLRFRGDGGNAIIDYFLNGFLELNGNGTSTGYRFYNNGTTRLDGATVVNGRITIDRGTPGTQYLEATRGGNETFEIIPLGLPSQIWLFQNYDRIGGGYKPIQIDTNQLILGKEGSVEVFSQLTVPAATQLSSAVNLSQINAYNSKTGNYTLVDSDILVDFTSGSNTATLPTAVGISGKKYLIKNTGTGSTTIATTSSQTIDGNSNLVLFNRYSVAELTSDGANWKITGTYNTTSIVNTEMITAQTAATLNSAYPSAGVPFTVFAPGVGTGMVYIKTTTGGQWMMYSGALLNP